jgi:hypothetical protein
MYVIFTLNIHQEKEAQAGLSAVGSHSLIKRSVNPRLDLLQLTLDTVIL